MKKGRSRYLALFIAAGLTAGMVLPSEQKILSADEVGGTGDVSQDAISQEGDAGDVDMDDGGALFEDDGSAEVSGDGVPMEQLQEVMKNGDAQDLQSFENGTAAESEGHWESETQSEVQVAGEDGPDIEPADPEKITQLLADLSAFDSVTGSNDELKAADYIAEQMKSLGYQVESQSFHEGFIDETGSDEQGMNVLAERLPNSEARQTQDILLVSTHYDTKRKKDPADPFASDRTGAVVLLEAARILSTVETDTDICFLFLSGEEDGLYGAQNFIASLDEATKARIVGLIDLEKVGYSPESFYILKNQTGEEDPGNQSASLLKQTGIDYFDDTEEESEPETALSESSEPETALSESSETETESGAVVAPEPWDYVKDNRLTQSVFAKEGFKAVTLTQYFPGDELEPEDETESEQAQTNLPGVSLVDETPETGNVSAEETAGAAGAGETAVTKTGEAMTEADEKTVHPDPVLMSDVADVLAETLAKIMDPDS